MKRDPSKYEILKELAKKIKLKRQQLNLTQEELAEKSVTILLISISLKHFAALS